MSDNSLTVKQELELDNALNDREWTCPVCGAHHDRDLLAARNIRRRGIADLGSTCKTGSAG